jgi:hypothetical protein
MENDVAKEIKKDVPKEKIQDQEYVNDSGIGGASICPRCRWDTREVPVPVGEEDKKEYIRSILGDSCFSKEYSIFGGEFKIKFTDLISTEADNLVRVLTNITDDPLFLAKAIKIKIIFGLVSFSRGTTDTIPDRDRLLDENLDVADYLKIYNELVGELPETLCGMMAKLYNDFTNLIISLAESAFDENFWKGAGRD